MLQRYKLEFALGIAIVISAIYAAAAEELLELSCSDGMLCRQFEHSGIRATCVDAHCRCQSSEGVPTPCRPAGDKQNNMIGGFCPCLQEHAYCNLPQDTCYCDEDFVASLDRRRCLRQLVPLGEKCELDEQCQAVNSAAICATEQRTCSCQKGYIQLEDKCVSLLGTASTSCEDDAQCDMYGAHATCATDVRKCVCMPEYVAAANASICLEAVDFNAACEQNSQCQMNTGVGAVCIAGQCQCQAGFWPLSKNATASSNATKMACEPIPMFGKYCRTHEQCYQHHMPSNEQSMVCDRGECNCRWGYKWSINVNCTRENHSAAFGFSKLLMLLAMALLRWSN